MRTPETMHQQIWEVIRDTWKTLTMVALESTAVSSVDASDLVSSARCISGILLESTE